MRWRRRINRYLDWLRLLPAASGLTNLWVQFPSTNNQTFCAILRSGTNLKSLELYSWCGDVNILLNTISLLPSLESLMIRSHDIMSLDLQNDLQRLFTGPVGCSLMSCRLSFYVDDEELRKYLLRFFKEQVELLSDKRPTGTLELVLTI
mmetsp:Transcript_10804/g.27174  ORF Transcript_10804/g.27174 Transcript_10804/m.27174 type:complete len:149 (-) Transcript_10804:251-697(-)